MHSRTQAIRHLNDRLRCHHCGGKIVVTNGLLAKGAAFIAALDAALTTYKPAVLDAHDEYDFGAVAVEGETVVFRIDYFDLSGRHPSPDPANEHNTLRVLTLMLAEEH